jgi:pyruvate formate lyase activating enzyme
MSKGIIFNIEEFGVHDGPGIRKIVFFKGCNLHCNWCHNPEGLSFQKEILRTKDHRKTICGVEYEASELAEILLKGKEVLINSGGGITISGGEPLAQPEFLIDLMDHLKPIHLVVETSGYSKKGVFKKMAAKADIVFMDLKHSDSALHEWHTGVGNELILENLEYLCGADTDFVIRIPLIPGVNDTRINMKNIANLITDADHLLRVELLPYHKTAGAKYPMLGRKYNPKFDEAKEIEICTEVFLEHNIEAVVL